MRKRGKFSALSGRVIFEPSGLETPGPFGSSARAHRRYPCAHFRSDQRQSVRTLLCRQVAASVQAGNAACIIEAHAHGRGP